MDQKFRMFPEGTNRIFPGHSGFIMLLNPPPTIEERIKEITIASLQSEVASLRGLTRTLALENAEKDATIAEMAEYFQRISTNGTRKEEQLKRNAAGAQRAIGALQRKLKKNERLIESLITIVKFTSDPKEALRQVREALQITMKKPLAVVVKNPASTTTATAPGPREELAGAEQ